jgi:hypothetical protein
LQPYQEATSQIEGRLARLADLTKDNSVQQQRTAELRRLEHEELAVLQQTIQRDQEGNDPEAGKIMLSGIGKKQMDEFRRVVADMETEEDRLLATRASLARRGQWATGLASLAIAVLSIVVFVLVVRQIRNAARSAELAQPRLKGDFVQKNAFVLRRKSCASASGRRRSSEDCWSRRPTPWWWWIERARLSW